MIQPNTLPKVMCNFKLHEGESVVYLCLRPQCVANSASCSQCSLQFHRECLDQLKLFNQIPELINFTQNLQSNYEDLVQMFTQMLKQVKMTLDTLLKPINKYIDSPNLYNLNELGDLLKQNPQQQIKLLSEESNKGLKQEITNFLQKFINSVDEIQKAQAIRWFVKYKQAEKNDCRLALHCIEKAIEFDQLNGEYWHQNGLCLQYFKRLDEAIIALNKSIQIQPTSQIYAEKVIILELLNKLNQAKDCCKEGLQQFSNDPFLNFRYNSINMKISSRNDQK